MKHNLQILAVGIVMTFATTPVSASVKVATFQGTIISGYDETGLFGIPGQDLAGISYVSTYTYDRSRGNSQTDGLTYDRSGGGTQFGTLSPVIDSKVTINGVTLHIPSEYRGSIGVTASPGQYSTNLQVTYSVYNNVINGPEQYERNLLNDSMGFGGSSLEQNVLPMPIGDPNGHLEIFHYNYDTGVMFANVLAVFSGDSVVYSVSDAVAGVPEPASWVMLIAGFGLTGASLRRKRSLRAA